MIETILFTAPAWVSNTLTAVFYYFFIVCLQWVPGWPLDGARTFAGKRIFGNNKTVFGSLSMLFFAAVIGWAQGSICAGLGMGIATLIGGLLNSFIKRRMGIPEGRNLFFMDQVDYALAVLVYLYLFQLEPFYFAPGLFLGFIFLYQLIINWLAFHTGFVRKNPLHIRWV